MTTISFTRHQFPPDIIRHAVWLYLRFTLSFRDVEDLLAERGLELSYETVRRWVLKFGPLFARELRRRRHRPTPQWHLDEMAVLISGKQFWLWRAVDDEGEILDLLVQRRRDAKAAARLMRKLLKKHGFAPTLLVTDKLRSYGAARTRLRLSVQRTVGNCQNSEALLAGKLFDDRGNRMSPSHAAKGGRRWLLSFAGCPARSQTRDGIRRPGAGAGDRSQGRRGGARGRVRFQSAGLACTASAEGERPRRIDRFSSGAPERLRWNLICGAQSTRRARFSMCWFNPSATSTPL